MGRWWLVNFNVSAVRCPLSVVRCPLSAVRCHKGFHVLNSARQASPCKRPRARGQDTQYLRKVIQFRNNSRSKIARAARMKVTN